ncbi:NAD(P)-binding protein [Artomyces pyxidatus]|uniref:NAD(P)-binding protein n=1 Tax=Artomyces pyxidatus TaxID=48021 RepID=A0ACB8SSI1_9AGAM|nr:NAD(P)-binding protein [Artomyces pyxidatus]
MSGKSALLIGATGQTGRHLLRELLASPQYSRVGEAGRRVTPADQLPAGAQGKLEQKVVDFENLEQAGLKEGKWDVVFITLGTSAKSAGSSANFEKIDREYVVNAAKAAKTDGEQRLIYLSSNVSNPTAYALYPRSKGLTEQALAETGYSDTIIFRPGFLRNVKRDEFRPLEVFLGPVSTVLSHFSPNLEIGVDKLAKSMRIAGEVGSAGLPARAEATKTNWGGKTFTAIGNKGCVLLSKE